MRASAAIAAGSIALAGTATVSRAAPSTVRALSPHADTHVNAAAPRRDYQRARRLVLRAKPAERAFLQFDVHDVAGPRTTAVLRVRALRGSRQGFVVRAVTSRNGSRRLTYRDAPRLGARIATSGSFAAGKWVTVDVTRAVRGHRKVTFALTTTSPAAIVLASREAGPRSAPRLEITQGSSGVPAFGAAAPLAPPGEVAPVAPVAVVAPPEISGHAWQDRTLAATPGIWSGGPGGVAYQWRLCDASGGSCKEIAGATAAQYTLGGGDLGRTIRVVASASNEAGAATATSEQTAVVTKAPPSPTVKSAPSISGRAQTGLVLTARPGTWKGAEPIGFAYQWLRCDTKGAHCVAVDGAGASEYAVDSADLGATLRVAVSASNLAGSTTVNTKASDTVKDPPPPPTIGVVGLWHMDELSGTTMLDGSGLGNNGKLKNVLVNQPGLVGAGYYFNGKSAIATIPSNASMVPGSHDFSWSVSLRFNSKPSGSVDSWDPMRKGYSDSSGGDFKMEVEPNGELSCYFKGSSGSGRVTDNRNLADDVWHTITCSRRGGSIKIDVDGRTSSSSSSIGSISNSAPLVLGARTSGMEFFNGFIDEANMTVG